MAHAHAALTPKHRLRLARLIVEDGWPSVRAAEFFNVSWRTATKWAQRYLVKSVKRWNSQIYMNRHVRVEVLVIQAQL